MKYYIISWTTLIGLLCLFSSSLISNSPSNGVSAEPNDEENEFHLDDSYDDDEDDFVEYEDGVFEDEEPFNKREVNEEDEEEDMSELEELLGDDGIISRINKRQTSFIAPKGFIRAPPGPPPSTINRPKKISFDTRLNVDDETFQTAADDQGLKFRIGSTSDEDASDWSVVTPAGYEYEAQKTELKSIFAAARYIAAAGPDSNDDGMSDYGIPVAGGRPIAAGPDSIDDDTPVADGGTGPTSFVGPIGPPGPPPARRIQRSVFHPDTRRKVTNTNRFPWSAIGRFDNGCTGFFIGPRHILTAGHCVYSRKTKKWSKRLNFRRRKNCDPHRGTRYIWKYAITVKGWKKFGWASYDYAMVVVRTTSPVRLGYGWRRFMPRWTINIAGYPADKSKRCMWRSSCRIHRRYSKMLGYKCDTYNGNSGSPVYVYWRNKNKRITYGIHAYGRSRGRNFNRCVRITKSRFKQFQRWIKKYN